MVQLSNLAVQLEANVADFKGDMRMAQATMRNVRSSAQKMGKTMRQTGLAMTAVGAGMGMGLKQAVDAAAEFEEGIAKVAMVTDDATANAMADEIREMAEVMPVAQDELSKIAADAGRFGVEGPENIREFTDAVAKMSVATTLSANEAGESLARIATLTDTPIDEIENLGSAVNELSNNFATSGKEIADGMLRSGAALSQLGMEQTEIAGLSAALNEVSESSRRAGSRLRRLAQEMVDPAKADGLAEALGLSVEEFKQMRDESPIKMIQMMAERMKEGGESADDLRETLSVTSQQALAGLGQNMEGLNDALSTSTEHYDENISLQEEFDRQSDTFASRLKMVKNRLRNVGITIGNYLLPPLERALDVVENAIDWFENLDDGLRETITKFALFTTAVFLVLGPLLMLTGAIIGLVSVMGGKLIIALGALVAGFVGLVMAFQSTADSGTSLQDITGTIADVFRSLHDVATDLWSTFNSELRPELEELADTLMDVGQDAMKMFESDVLPVLEDFGHTFIEIAGEIVTQINDHLIPALSELKDGLVPVLETVAENISDMVDEAREMGVFEAMRDILSEIIPIVSDIVEVVGKWLQEHGELVGEIITFVGTALAIGLAIYGIVQAVIAVVAAISSFIATAAAIIGMIIAILNPITLLIGIIIALAAAWATNFLGIREKTRSAISTVREWFNKAVDAAMDLWNGIKEAAQGVIDAVTDIWDNITGAVDSIISTLMRLWDRFQWVFSLIAGLALIFIGAFIAPILGAIALLFLLWKNNFLGIRDITRDVFNAVRDKVGGAIDWVVEKATVLWEALTEAFEKIRKKAKEIIDKVVEKIKELWEKAKEFFGKIADKAKEAFDKLVTKVEEALKPLADKFDKYIVEPITDIIEDAWDWGSNLVSGFIDGVKSALGKIAQAVIEFAKKIEDYLGLFSPARKGPLSNVPKWGKNLVTTFINGMLSKLGWLVGKVVSFVTTFATTFKNTLLNGIRAAINGAKIILNAYINFWRTVFTKALGIARTIWNRIWGAISSIVNRLWSFLQTTWNAILTTIRTVLNRLWTTANQIWNSIWTTIQSIVTRLWNWLTTTWNSILATISQVLSSLWQTAQRIWTQIWTTIQGIVTQLWNWLTNTFNTILSTLTRILTNLFNTARRIWTNLKDTIVRLATTLKERAVELVTKLKERAVELFTNLKERAVELWTNLKERVVELVTNLKERAVELITNLKERVDTLITNLKNRLLELWETIKSKVIDKAKKLKDDVETKIEDLKDNVIDFISSMKDDVLSVFDELKRKAKDKAKEMGDDVVTKLENTIGDLPSDAREWGEKIISNFVSGIKSKKGSVGSAVSNTVQEARDRLPFSDAKRGPLSDLSKTGPALVKTLTDGIRDNVGEAGRAAEEAAGQLASYLGVSSDTDSGPLSRLTRWGPALIGTLAGGIEGEMSTLDGVLAKIPGVGKPLVASSLGAHGAIPFRFRGMDREKLIVEEGAVKISRGAFQGVADDEMADMVGEEVQQTLDQVIDDVRGRGQGI